MARKKQQQLPGIDLVPRQGTLVDHFFEAHLAKHGYKPLVTDGDGKLIHLLSKALGDDEVRTLIDFFFSTTDAHVVQCNYSIKEFYTRVPRLRLLRSRGTIDRRTAENVDAAIRAMQPRRH